MFSRLTMDNSNQLDEGDENNLLPTHANDGPGIVMLFNIFRCILTRGKARERALWTMKHASLPTHDDYLSLEINYSS